MMVMIENGIKLRNDAFLIMTPQDIENHVESREIYEQWDCDCKDFTYAWSKSYLNMKGIL